MNQFANYPGYGFLVTEMPQISQRADGNDRYRFPTAVLDWEPVPVTRRERTMLAFMDAITDKPEWRRKVFDSAIVEKWRDEADALDDFSEEMFKHVSTTNA